MRSSFLRFSTIAFMAIFGMLAHQDATAQAKKSRLLFIVDASSSMSYEWHNKETRFDAARKVILAIMDSMYAINNEVEFAVRVYGNQSVAQKKDCYDTKLEVDFGLQNSNQISTRLKYVIPIGSSPIAFSIGEASRNELNNTGAYDYSFVLITDGGESCGGDICDAYQKLVANKVKVNPYIIGLDTNKALLRYYECLGKYVSVTKPNEIAAAVQLILDNNRSLLDKKKVLGIATTYSAVGALEKPVFVGQESSVNFLPPISRIKLITSVIKVPRAAYLVYRKPSRIEDLFIPDAKAPIESISQLNAINARKIPSEFRRALPYRKWSLKPTTFPKEWMVFEDKAAINMSKIASNVIRTKAINLPPTKKGMPKNLAKLSPIVLEFEKQPIAIDILPSKTFVRNFLTIKEPKFPNKKLGKYSVIKIEPDDMDSVKIAGIWSNQFRLSYTPSKPKPKYNAAPKMRKINAPVIAAKKVEPKPAETPKAEEPVYNIQTVASTETKIQVYFTDGKGKFYNTKPDIIIVDPVTNVTKKTFIRTIFGGEPEPIKLDFDGVYDVAVLGQQNNIVLHNVSIPKNKTTKIYLKVEKGTLVFTYRDNRNRPVELQAKVSIRNKTGTDAVTVQCTEKRMFEPGDYGIEIEVLPPYVVVTEISFGATTEIQLPQLGAVQFTNTQNIGKVQLYVERVDHFEIFHQIVVTGEDLASQKVMLRPGVYQANFVQPGLPPNSPPTLTKFVIKSNMITEVELRDIGQKAITPEGTGNLIYTKETPKINFNIETQKK
jgi:von Willebrand factor type A domain